MKSKNFIGIALVLGLLIFVGVNFSAEGVKVKTKTFEAEAKTLEFKIDGFRHNDK